MTKTTGGAAFPTVPINGDQKKYAGMTLRDYFAAKALPAVIDAYIRCNGHVIGTDHIISNVPKIAYKFADSLLAERET